jgi:hypothetical protein
MILIVPNAPAELTRITVQATANKVSAAIAATTHQAQVFSAPDIKLMTFLL